MQAHNSFAQINFNRNPTTTQLTATITPIIHPRDEETTLATNATQPARSVVTPGGAGGGKNKHRGEQRCGRIGKWFNNKKVLLVKPVNSAREKSFLFAWLLQATTHTHTHTHTHTQTDKRTQYRIGNGFQFLNCIASITETLLPLQNVETLRGNCTEEMAGRKIMI